MKALSGQHTVLAKPPKRVRLVIDWRAPAAVHAAERGEHRVVEAGAHAEADQHPAGEVDRQRRRQTGDRQTGREQQRTGQQHGPAAVTLDDAADLRRDQPGAEQRDRSAADHPGQRPAGIGDDGDRKHRREIERRAPGQDLDDAERCNDGTAVNRADRQSQGGGSQRPRRENGLSRGNGMNHPPFGGNLHRTLRSDSLRNVGEFELFSPQNSDRCSRRMLRVAPKRQETPQLAVFQRKWRFLPHTGSKNTRVPAEYHRQTGIILRRPERLLDIFGNLLVLTVS